MDSINKIEYNLRNLTTRSVTLFPTRAQVFRDVKSVPLRPGSNEVTIFGLSPTVDEDSIKVDGSGAATISNIAVESLPNRDTYQDLYPDSDGEGWSDDDDDDDDDIEEPKPKESAELISARAAMKQAQRAMDKATEDIENAKDRRQALWEYNRTLNAKDVDDIEETFTTYKSLRESAYQDLQDAETRMANASEDLVDRIDKVQRLERQHERAHAQVMKEHRRAVKARDKALAQKMRRRSERAAEKERVRREREKFWPKYCYAVRIQLDASSFAATPTSSRRGSLSSDVELLTYGVVKVGADTPHDQRVDKAGKAAAVETITSCDLVLSYVTTSASWSPSYDLQLSTTNTTGSLCFDAQLENTTSETWEKCQITLSTSQTSSTSLDETAPVLAPWRAQLGSKSNFHVANRDKDMTISREEKSYKEARLKNLQEQSKQHAKRSNMFGFDATLSEPDRIRANQDYQMQLMVLEQQNKQRLAKARQEQNHDPSRAPARGLFGIPQPPPPPPPPQQQQQQQQQTGGLFGQPQAKHKQSTRGGLFGQAQNSMHQHTFGGFQSSGNANVVPASSAAQAKDSDDDDDDDVLFGSAPVVEEEEEKDEESESGQQLDFEESLIEDTGFTTSYDLPSAKTLAPGSTTSKQRIARVHFKDVIFNYTVVAKYKPHAHLSAKLQNTSKVSLLRGPVGVTLDGSFMGRTTLPRCGGGGEYFSLSLGIDPAIRVAYAPPTMQRASVGFFTKEDILVYERCITLENTRTADGKHVKLLVRDQVPVSNDEKLRIELHEPKGLMAEGEAKSAGEPARARDQDGWGMADARLKKDGEVTWLVALRPGKSVKLPLQYIVATPIGDCAVEVKS